MIYCLCHNLAYLWTCTQSPGSLNNIEATIASSFLVEETTMSFLPYIGYVPKKLGVLAVPCRPLIPEVRG